MAKKEIKGVFMEKDKEIERISDKYFKATDKINKLARKIEEELELFRSRCVNEILMLKDKDEILKKLK